MHRMNIAHVTVQHLHVTLANSTMCRTTCATEKHAQETGNVPYVTENDFGLYRKRPADIAHEVSDLLADRERLEKMGAHARSLGRPRASLDIAKSIVSKLLPGTMEIAHKP